MTELSRPSPHTEYLKAILSGREELRIDIPDLTGKTIGHLEPLTQARAEDEQLIATFVRWRNQNLSGWLDQRPVTFEGTRNWARSVTRDPTRLALLMYADSKLVGRCGLLELTAEDCLSDGLVRGERGGGFFFIHYAQVAVLHWQFERLGIESVLSKVLASNEQALESCRRLGYDLTCIESRTLYRHEDSRGVFLLEQGTAAQLVNDCSVCLVRLWKNHFHAAVQQLDSEGS